MVSEVKGASWALELIPTGMFVRRVVTLGEAASTSVIVSIQPASGKVEFKVTGSGPSLAEPQDMLLLLEQVVAEARAAYDGSEVVEEREGEGWRTSQS